MAGLANWWDSVELWLAGLWFPFQFGILLLVLLPLAWGFAVFSDRVTARMPRRSRPTRPGRQRHHGRAATSEAEAGGTRAPSS